MRIIQLGDIHLLEDPDGTLKGVRPQASLLALLDHLRRRHLPADRILIHGDLVQDESFAAAARLADILGTLETPIHVAAGNHDPPALLRACFGQPPFHLGRRVPLDPGWSLLLADSGVRGAGAGRLSTSELQSLDRRLAEAADRHVLVGLHHQPVPVGSAWLDDVGLSDPAALFAVLDRHPNVRAVLFGHVHQEFAGRRGDVALLGTPATCHQFLPGADDQQLDPIGPGYRWLELRPDGRIDTGVERLAAG